MSIFRDTFSPEVSASLDIRQNAMVDRTPQNLQYLNARNAWIRMTSAVNVDGTNELAKQYILLGGTLDPATLTSKSGVGYDDPSKAYSNKSPSGKTYRLGIRPMPGITSIDVKSLTAYGSLREITVNFQCWDIAQLEDLELLYMRPGYTVLIEWGWLPYLWKDSSGNTTLQRTLPEPFYDILDKSNVNRTTIFKELFDKSKKSGGNYDAMYGYIKNYQWSARADGGYDCQTTVISTGEIIESLKVNYVSPNLASFNDIKYNGLLSDEFTSNVGLPLTTSEKTLAEYYQKNILAGIWAETYLRLFSESNRKNLSPDSVFKGSAIVPFLGLSSTPTDLIKPASATLVSGSQNQVYVRLETVFDILNKYVIPKSSTGDNEPLIYLSLNSSTITNPTSSDLYCIAHPLQVSVNPTVCLINSPLWSDEGKVVTAVGEAVTGSITSQIQSIVTTIKNAQQGIAGTTKDDAYNAIRSIPIEPLQTFITINASLEKPIDQTINEFIKNRNSRDLLYYDQGRRRPGPANGVPVYTPLGRAIEQLKRIFSSTPNSIEIKEYNRGGEVLLESIKITLSPQQSGDLVSLSLNGQGPQAVATLTNISKNLRPFFYDSPYSEIGIIKNIYVNVEFLYKKALDGFVESQDTKEKNEINLYNYVKSIMREIQSAIGNINNFEIHVDPVDNNVARVIDVNYTEPDKANKKKLFELQVHNLKSVVRNYSLQSKIFPNQGALVAIGSQAKGGQLGMQNNTMIDFNRNVVDRITPEKIFGGEDNLKINVAGDKKTTPVAGNLAAIIKLYSALSKTPENAPAPKSDAPPPLSTDTVDFNLLYSTAKNNLRDLIVYFQSIPSLKSPSANRNIIPIQFSFEMDGIGGLVIGHLFTINQDVLPRGYKGPNLAQTVTRIGHTISNNDWVTKVEALNIVLDNKRDAVINFQELDLTKIVNESLQGAFGKNLPAQPEPTTPFFSTPCGPLQRGEKPVGASYTDVKYLIRAIVETLEGGYYNGDTHKNSFSKEDQKKYGSSGETMFGIDYINGSGYRKYDPAAWDEFWYDIWKNQGYTVTGTIGRGISKSGTPSKPWRRGLIDVPPLLADKLYSLVTRFMSKATDDLFKQNRINSDLERLIKSDGRLYYNFLYAVWNGAGWFKGWVIYISRKYQGDSGVKSAAGLTKLFVEDRRNGGVESFAALGKTVSKNAENLIKATGQKICRQVGNL